MWRAEQVWGRWYGFLPWATFSNQVASMNIQTRQNHEILHSVGASIKEAI